MTSYLTGEEKENIDVRRAVTRGRRSASDLYRLDSSAKRDSYVALTVPQSIRR